MLWAVIMAGGVGSRFWPESREKKPKQYLPLLSSKTLIEETVDRLGKTIPPSRVLIVTQQDKVALARKILKKVPRENIFGEPVGRNTAPCAILAAAIAYKKDPDAVISLLPADHKIGKPALLQKSLKVAHDMSYTKNLPVTFGVKPLMPHTGYGYLELGKTEAELQGHTICRLKSFREKPTLSKAKTYFKSGKFLWNSGMFVWKAADLLEAAEKYLPKAHKLSLLIAEKDFTNRLKRLFPKMPNISIDYSLMEKMENRILAMPVNFGWNDVGGWQNFQEVCKKDKEGNVTFGPSLLIESRGNIVRSKDRLVVLLGVEDYAVVDTPDALLVCPKDQSESIKKVVKALKNKKLSQYL